MVLDVTDMRTVENEGINVVLATELFEHVKYPVKGLKECYRVLRTGGVLIMSAPFLYPIHADPSDYQRWTKDKWDMELKKIGFKIEKFNVMGKYFTVTAEFAKFFFRNNPIKYLFYIFYPLLDLWAKCDRFLKPKSKLSNFQGGYFMILRK